MTNSHQTQPPQNLISTVLQGFQTIKQSPPELWKAFLLKFLESFAYFSFSIIFTIFLSSDFGYNDVTAGTLYGSWGAFTTLFGLMTGFLIDNLGVTCSLKVGFFVSLLSKIIILCTTSRFYLLVGMCLLSLGNCLGIPVLTVGIRRYTTDENQGFAFGLFYVVMNVAALLSGPVVDACSILYKDDDVNNNNNMQDSNHRILEQNSYYNNEYEPKEWTLTSSRLVIFLGIIANFISCIVSFTMKEIKVTSNNDDVTGKGKSIMFQPTKASCLEILKEVMSTKVFWRFSVVCMITLNVRMIFRHLDATLPKYMVREFGENVPKGTIYSINPFLIIILVPLITSATTNVNPLIMIHHGSYISAASVFFLVASTSIPSCILFVIFLSIGEAVWSPRLYDYTMKICPEGREGTYMALTSAPLFLAKLPVGFMSGYLLQRYCPEEGERNSKMMWLIIGLTTAVSPVLMTLLWKYISATDETESPILSHQYSEISTTNTMEMRSYTDETPLRSHDEAKEVIRNNII